MTSPAMTLEVLPAGYGDCLLVSCPVGRRTWRLLVDTGPDETFPSLKARLSQLPQDGHGKRFIDLFIVTHIDHDHIGGAGLLLNDRSLGLSFGDIWFNAPPHPAVRGVAEGESLAQMLGAADIALPWNKAFGAKGVVTEGAGGFVELGARTGAPRITVLSPTPERLADLFKVWGSELARLHNKETDKPEPSEPQPRDATGMDIEALADKITPTDHSTPNGSSIAVLLEHKGASVLLGADAVPTVMVPAVRALARHRGVADSLKLDVVKLSHHGSRANVTNELLKAVQADHYVFSTNNAIFNHPDDEAVARVLVHGGRASTLLFNYATERNRRWESEQLISRYNYAVRYPLAGQLGVTLAVTSKVRTLR